MAPHRLASYEDVKTVLRWLLENTNSPEEKEHIMKALDNINLAMIDHYDKEDEA